MRALRTLSVVGFLSVVLTGCNSIQVHLGIKLYLAKTPVASMTIAQYKHVGIGPGEKSSLQREQWQQWARRQQRHVGQLRQNHRYLRSGRPTVSRGYQNIESRSA